MVSSKFGLVLQIVLFFAEIRNDDDDEPRSLHYLIYLLRSLLPIYAEPSPTIVGENIPYIW